MGIIKTTVSLAALGAGAMFAGKAVKNKKFCPVCMAKKLMSAASVHASSEGTYDNGVALTPPMGWSSWNTLRHNISEDVIKEMATAMKASGLLDAGYKYVNLDDCWQSSMRTPDGKLQGDLRTFPHGIKALVEEINAMGMKVGIYTSNGTLTCEDLPASLYNEAVDAATFAEWGIEYFKYDFCHNEAVPTKAPLVDRIIIGNSDSGFELTMEAETGELYGQARIAHDDKVLSGSYVTGLCANNGALQFSNVEIPEDGEYLFTLVFRKSTGGERFAVVTVNGEAEYSITTPSTNAMTPEGRVQTVVKLKAGANTIKISNPVGSRMDGAARQYTNMGLELKKATKAYALANGVPEKPIVYSICEWGLNRPWKWGAQAGNLWRTTMDIKAFWGSVLGIYEFNVRLAKYAGPGGWNDPDMLEVGNGSLTYEENKTHFTLWCMMAAPLILGNDLRTFLKADGTVDADNRILDILTNRALIAVDQDALGIQCRRVRTNGICDVLVKPLEDNTAAICFFNKSGSEKTMSASIASDILNESRVTLPKAERYTVSELWDNEVSVTPDEIKAVVPSHGVKVYIVKA
ncbi:MAG: alpha-galactosidase [Clostridiales bacterium]|nr:alpha-galactosidase [Clostridiales bacterium]